jgi:hypothetical protein
MMPIYTPSLQFDHFVIPGFDKGKIEQSPLSYTNHVAARAFWMMTLTGQAKGLAAKRS